MILKMMKNMNDVAEGKWYAVLEAFCMQTLIQWDKKDT